MHDNILINYSCYVYMRFIPSIIVITVKCMRLYFLDEWKSFLLCNFCKMFSRSDINIQDAYFV